MGILGSTRLSEEDINYVLFEAPAGADSAFTLSFQLRSTLRSLKAPLD